MKNKYQTPELSNAIKKLQQLKPKFKIGDVVEIIKGLGDEDKVKFLVRIIEKYPHKYLDSFPFIVDSVGLTESYTELLYALLNKPDLKPQHFEWILTKIDRLNSDTDKLSLLQDILGHKDLPRDITVLLLEAFDQVGLKNLAKDQKTELLHKLLDNHYVNPQYLTWVCDKISNLLYEDTDKLSLLTKLLSGNIDTDKLDLACSTLKNSRYRGKFLLTLIDSVDASQQYFGWILENFSQLDYDEDKAALLMAMLDNRSLDQVMIESIMQTLDTLHNDRCKLNVLLKLLDTEYKSQYFELVLDNVSKLNDDADKIELLKAILKHKNLPQPVIERIKEFIPQYDSEGYILQGILNNQDPDQSTMDLAIERLRTIKDEDTKVGIIAAILNKLNTTPRSDDNDRCFFKVGDHMQDLNNPNNQLYLLALIASYPDIKRESVLKRLDELGFKPERFSKLKDRQLQKRVSMLRRILTPRLDLPFDCNKNTYGRVIKWFADNFHNLDNVTPEILLENTKENGVVTLDSLKFITELIYYFGSYYFTDEQIVDVLKKVIDELNQIPNDIEIDILDKSTGQLISNQSMASMILCSAIPEGYKLPPDLEAELTNSIASNRHLKFNVLQAILDRMHSYSTDKQAQILETLLVREYPANESVYYIAACIRELPGFYQKQKISLLQKIMERPDFDLYMFSMILPLMGSLGKNTLKKNVEHQFMSVFSNGILEPLIKNPFINSCPEAKAIINTLRLAKSSKQFFVMLKVLKGFYMLNPELEDLTSKIVRYSTLPQDERESKMKESEEFLLYALEGCNIRLQKGLSAFDEEVKDLIQAELLNRREENKQEGTPSWTAAISGGEEEKKSNERPSTRGR
jgi:hypothetical protein